MKTDHRPNITLALLVITVSLLSALLAPSILSVHAATASATSASNTTGATPSSTDTTALAALWHSLDAEDYQQALELSMVRGQQNPLYFELAFYLSAISFNSGDQRRQILEELRYADYGDATIEAFLQELKNNSPANSTFHKLVEAMVTFNDYQNERRAIALVIESLAERETVFGYYLQYAFTDDIEGLKKAIALAERPASMIMQLLIHNYNADIDVDREPNEAYYVAEFEKLLADDSYYFNNQDYQNFLQMGLGMRWVGAIGPAGPNNEPFFGELCAVTAWDSIPKFAPRHQVLFALAVGGPGGQNTPDAERVLEYIDEQTLQTYAPLVKMLKIYENFHDYQYDVVYQLADELLAMDISDPFYFMYLYDLAYEYEVFFFEGYYPDQTMIDKAVLLYDKAFQLAPPESPLWQAAVLRDKGRSQFYAKQYEASIATLTESLALHEDHICDVFICLDYYGLEDYENGAIWEQRVREVFADNRGVLADFEYLLSEVK